MAKANPLLAGLELGPEEAEPGSGETDTDEMGIEMVSGDVADAIVSGDRDSIKTAVASALRALRG